MRHMGDLPAAASAYEQALACRRGSGEEGQDQQGLVDLYAALGACVLGVGLSTHACMPLCLTDS